MNTQSRNAHEECWLLLPWLANGRLGPAERASTEEHVRSCGACAAELERQDLMCAALTLPERVTHAPGPSLRKLMERIDGATPVRAAASLPLPRTHRPGPRLAATWRPPGLAWAATFMFALGVGILAPTFYRWSQPAYSTYTSAPRVQGEVLHVAFERSLTVGEVAELLRSADARIVEGPDNTGIFGVAPVTAGTAASGQPGPRLHALAARLQGDARVRWIEPLPQDSAGARAPAGNPTTP